MRTVRAFWWTGRPNFGDLLTPLLLRRFSHLKTEGVPIADADLIVVGSILESLPEGWQGVVAGAGKMFEHTAPKVRKATVLGLRGPLTAQNIRGYHSFGDPGLLSNELVTVNKEYDLGIVPHWSDTELEHRPEFQKYNPRIIRPSANPLDVISEIGRCRKIISSSLHGVIVADSFGIPRRTEIAPRMEFEGGMFKFRDHAAALDLPFEIGITQQPPRSSVQELQYRVFDVFEAVSDYFS